jgi:hypothetical protein
MTDIFRHDQIHVTVNLLPALADVAEHVPRCHKHHRLKVMHKVTVPAVGQHNCRAQANMEKEAARHALLCVSLPFAHADVKLLDDRGALLMHLPQVSARV